MIVVVLAYGFGAVAAAALWRAARDRFQVDALARRNYRDAAVVTGVGIVIPVAAAAVASVGVIAWTLLAEFADPNAWPGLARGLSQLVPVLVVAFGFALLGLLDDVAGVGDSGGFRGHLTALARGRLTTGALKLVGGAWLGVIAAFATFRSNGVVDLLRDGAIVALGANTINLFDRAPGRANKVAQLAGLVVVAASLGPPELAGMALVMGAGVALLGPDLREEMMLGDAGSNVLGAAVGLGCVQSMGETGRWAALGAFVLINLASERWSFSRIIDNVAVLRRLDRWGSPTR